MHKFSTVALKPSALPVLSCLRAVLLSDLGFGIWDLEFISEVARLVRLALSPLRHENLCTSPDYA